jgi:hypothetical protein
VFGSTIEFSIFFKINVANTWKSRCRVLDDDAVVVVAAAVDANNYQQTSESRSARSEKYKIDEESLMIRHIFPVVRSPTTSGTP